MGLVARAMDAMVPPGRARSGAARAEGMEDGRCGDRFPPGTAGASGAAASPRAISIAGTIQLKVQADIWRTFIFAGRAPRSGSPAGGQVPDA